MAAHLIRPNLVLLTAAALLLASPGWSAQFPEARIFIEYNSTDDDLGFHVFLDAENWKKVTITNPSGTAIFTVQGGGAFGQLGLSELFTEGAEPTLTDVPLDQLFSLMPAGKYTFSGVTADGARLLSRATLSHAVPAGPVVATSVNGGTVTISWQPVTGPPPGFPDEPISIAGYQIIVAESFQVTLPADATHVTLPAEFVQSLGSGSHGYEVLAIDASGNQTITEGSFSN